MNGYLYLCGNESVLQQRIRKVWQEPAAPGPADGRSLAGDAGGGGDAGGSGGGHGDVPQVYLFRHWLERLLADAGRTRPVIGAAVRQVLLREVCRSLEKELEYLKGISQFSGFIRSVGEFISELKEAGVTPEQFAGVMNEGDWRRKDREVARIYQEYQRALTAAGVLDVQDLVREAADAVQKSGKGLLEGIQTIVLEGFVRFTPVEEALFQAIQTLGIQVITGLEPGKAAASGLDTVAASLNTVAASLNTASARIPLETGCVELFKAAAPEDEAKWIAKEVKGLLRSGRITHPGRIAVAFRSPAPYQRRVQEMLAAEGVPVGARSRVRLADIAVIRLVARLLNAAEKAADSGRTGDLAGDLLDVLASDYLSGFCEMEPDAFREAVAPFRSNQPVAEWVAGLAPLAATDERLARAREAVLRLDGLLEPLAGSGTAGEHRSRLLAVLAGLGLEEAILAGFGGSGGELAAVALELRSLQRLVSLLEEVERGYFLAGAADRRFSFSEYATVVRSLMEGLTLGERTPSGSMAGVEVLAAGELCGCEFEAVFIAGMAEGLFPQSGEFDWLYREEERRRLNDRGIPVSCRETADAAEERLFRAAAGAARRFLYLTFPVAGESGRANLPSRFLDEFAAADALPGPTGAGGPGGQGSPGGLGSPGGPGGQGWEDVGTMEELASRTFQDYRVLTPEIRKRLLAHLEEAGGYPVRDVERRMRIEEWREGAGFGRWDGVLLDDVLWTANGGAEAAGEFEVFLEARLGPEAMLSVTDLQDYGKCPMRFFFQKILGLRPLEEAAMEAAPVLEGSVIHQALHDFYRRHLGMPLDPARAGEYHQRVDGVLGQLLMGSGGHDLAAGVHPVLWRLQQERIRLLVHRLLDADLEVAGATGGRMAPRFLELRFGPARPGEIADPQSVDSPLILRRIPGEDGSTAAYAPKKADQVQIAGKIDRVDCTVYQDDPGRGDAGRFIVYDYKLSRGASSKEIQAGTDLQVPVYVRAVQELFLRDHEPVGGAYYSIREASRAGVWRSDHPELTGVGGRTGGQVDAGGWEAMMRRVENEIWRRVDGMRHGWFPCTPLDVAACDHCDYRDICRYEPRRIRRKMLAQGRMAAEGAAREGEGGARDARDA